MVETKMKKKIVKCQLCASTFTEVSKLNRHTREVHEALKKKYDCKECCKTFKRKEHLIRHQKGVHMDSKFSCRFCKRRFTELCLLKNHMRKKHKKKFCESCGEDFSPFSKTKHFCKNSKEKQNLKFDCQFCSKSYRRSGYLIRHLFKEHSDVKYGKNQKMLKNAGMIQFNKLKRKSERYEDGNQEKDEKIELPEDEQAEFAESVGDFGLKFEIELNQMKNALKAGDLISNDGEGSKDREGSKDGELSTNDASVKKNDQILDQKENMDGLIKNANNKTIHSEDLGKRLNSFGHGYIPIAPKLFGDSYKNKRKRKRIKKKTVSQALPQKYYLSDNSEKNDENVPNFLENFGTKSQKDLLCYGKYKEEENYEDSMHLESQETKISNWSNWKSFPKIKIAREGQNAKKINNMDAKKLKSFNNHEKLNQAQTKNKNYKNCTWKAKNDCELKNIDKNLLDSTLDSDSEEKFNDFAFINFSENKKLRNDKKIVYNDNIADRSDFYFGAAKSPISKPNYGIFCDSRDSSASKHIIPEGTIHSNGIPDLAMEGCFKLVNSFRSSVIFGDSDAKIY